MKNLEMAKEIAKRVDSLGGSCFFVGGYVRDKLQGIENKDIDIEVHGISFNQLQEILNSLGECKNIGSSFGVFSLNHYDLDIAMPRLEHTSGRGHRDFEVFVDPFIGLEKACSRRDFTINAMMENILTGEVIDFFGGKKDLENKIIRHVDTNTFLDDPLRVLRAAQFASRFNFAIAKETIDLCKTADLSSLSCERIRTELEKALLKSKKPSLFFNYLKEMGQLSIWFKELENLIGVPQDPKYHPEGDVWNHTMLVIDYAAKVLNKAIEPFSFMMSALYHDIGKATTTTKDEKGYHSYKHQYVGAKMVKKIPYIQEKYLLRYMQNMINKHMEPYLLLNSTTRENNYCKMYDTSLVPEDLILLALCDKFGREGVLQEEYDVNYGKLTKYLNIYKERMKLPSVTGKDLIDAGFKPSPLFSEALKKAHNFQVLGVSKEKALSQIISFLSKNKE